MRFQLSGELRYLVEVGKDGYTERRQILEEFDANNEDEALKKAKRLMKEQADSTTGAFRGCEASLREIRLFPT